jgi:hypothetical protein
MNATRENFMAVNLERFKNDLKELIELGQKLELAMMMEVSGTDKFRRQFLPGIPAEKAKEVMRCSLALDLDMKDGILKQ